MNLGEINKGAVILVVALLFGAGGYLWYSMLYKPAVTAQKAAETAATTAETALQAAEQQLATAQQQIEDAKKETAKLDDSVARLAKARSAIPSDKLIDDAAIALMEYAQRSGVQTGFTAGGDGGDINAAAAPGDSSLNGATPIDLEFEAAGTYSEMMHFIQLVESSVEEKDDKLFTRGRLFNVVKLEMGSDDTESQSGGFSADGSAEPNDKGFILGPNDIEFTVIVRMYTTSTGNAESVGALTPDPAASATDPAASGTDPGATGTTGTDPAATGAGTTGTDPAATGAGTTGTDPATATAGAGATTGGTTT